MRNFFCTLLVSVLLILAYSCRNDELNEDIQNVHSCSFYYDGVIYTSKFYYDADSVQIFEDERVNNVYQRLMENPNLVTVITEHGAIYYYDDYEDYIIKKEDCLVRK